MLEFQYYLLVVNGATFEGNRIGVLDGGVTRVVRSGRFANNIIRNLMISQRDGLFGRLGGLGIEQGGIVSGNKIRKFTKPQGDPLVPCGIFEPFVLAGNTCRRSIAPLGGSVSADQFFFSNCSAFLNSFDQVANGKSCQYNLV